MLDVAWLDKPSFRHPAVGKNCAEPLKELISKPRSNGRRETFLVSLQNFRGQLPSHYFAEEILAGRKTQFVPCGKGGRELNHLVIQEGNAAFDGRGHAHLVLFHEKFDEISLYVHVQQLVQRIPVQSVRW